MERIGGEHALDLAVDPVAALALLGQAADEWGADFTPCESGGGELRLPVTFGLRRGYLMGSIAVAPGGAGARLSFRVGGGKTQLQTASVGFLALGALGGLLLMLWPFSPNLARLAPIGAVFAFGAWFLVIARLHVSGPDEFLARVAELAAASPASEPAAEPT